MQDFLKKILKSQALLAANFQARIMQKDHKTLPQLQKKKM